MEGPHRAIYVIVQELYDALSARIRENDQIHSLIVELINLPFTKEESNYFEFNENLEPLMDLLCNEIKPSNEILTVETANLLHKFFKKTDHEFSESIWVTVTMWRIECLQMCTGSILTDVLFHIHDTLPKRTYSLAKFAESLIGPEGELLNILKTLIVQQQNWNSDVVKICVLLVRIISYLIVFLLQNTKRYRPNINKEQIADIIMELLMNGIPTSDCEFFYNMLIEPALRILAHLFYHNPDMDFSLPNAISISRHFLLYGLSIRYTKPDRLTPMENVIVPEPVKIAPKPGKKQKLRKPRNNAIENLKKEASDPSVMKDVDEFTKDSIYEPTTKNYFDAPQFAFEDPESTADFSFELKYRPKVTELKSKIRQYASKLFLVLIRVKGKREIFPYWWTFMPSNADPQHWFMTENGKKTIIFCASVDPIAKGRSSALGVILTLLSGSRPLLAQAEMSTRDKGSVVPFPVTLGYMIRCMHRAIRGILETERNEGVTIMALKCAAVLAQATPYHKLQPGLIESLIITTKKYFKNKDLNIQLGSLVAIGSFISVDPKVDEVLQALKNDTQENEVSNPTKCKSVNIPECDDFEESYSDDDMVVKIETEKTHDNKKLVKEVKVEKEITLQFTSWVLEICFKNVGVVFVNDQIMSCPLPSVPVILETLQVLSAVAFNYLAELLRPHLVMMTELLSDLLRIHHADLTLQCTKTISVIADGIQKLERIGQAPSMKECLYVWERLLNPLCGLLQSQENPNAKAVVCDCIANIGEKCFKELLRPQQMLCCALLMGSCNDEEPAVRAAAVRALAMAVMYRTLREDICFVSDCAENILRSLQEPTLLVRTKAAWAMANMSDALVLNMEVPELDRISDELLMRLLKASNVCATDNDKVRMSAMRSLGNLLRLITKQNLSRYPKLKNLFDTAISKLLHSANYGASMKVRWNACYALGNAMKNEYIFTCFQGWQSKVFPALCKLAHISRNIKVRITAAVALRSCARRAQLGTHLPAVWRGLTEAMDSAAHLDDFTEYKHKDNLAEQLCVTIAHICCMLEASDLADILDPLTYHSETTKRMFAEVYHKLLPEDTSCLKILQASKYLNMDLVPENDTQAQALNILKDIFLLEL